MSCRFLTFPLSENRINMDVGEKFVIFHIFKFELQLLD